MLHSHFHIFIFFYVWSSTSEWISLESLHSWPYTASASTLSPPSFTVQSFHFIVIIIIIIVLSGCSECVGCYCIILMRPSWCKVSSFWRRLVLRWVSYIQIRRIPTPEITVSMIFMFFFFFSIFNCNLWLIKLICVTTERLDFKPL